MFAGEAGINAEMVRRSKRAVVVAASLKLGQRAFARICGSDAIAPLVTDRDASDAHVGPLREAGVEVLLAGRGGWPWATRAWWAPHPSIACSPTRATSTASSLDC